MPLALCLSLGLGGTVQAEGALPPICARGVETPTLPLSHVLQLEFQDMSETQIMRVDYDLMLPEDSSDSKATYLAAVLAQAIEWPGVLADRAAELPPSAHDLPWLVLLNYMSSEGSNPIWLLTQSAESIVSPELVTIMERNGLAEEARVLREAMAQFPDWGLNPAERAQQVVSYEGATVDEARQASLDALERSWPEDRLRVARAAMRLIEAEPALQAAAKARVAGLDEDARLALVMEQLWSGCMGETWTPEESDQTFAAMGSVQAGLLMLASFQYTIEEASLYGWFDDSAAANSAMLARLLDRRGEEDIAQALRDGMAIFGDSFPRHVEDRWAQMQEMDEATLGRLDGLLPDDVSDRLQRLMVTLARENGLLPG